MSTLATKNSAPLLTVSSVISLAEASIQNTPITSVASFFDKCFLFNLMNMSSSHSTHFFHVALNPHFENLSSLFIGLSSFGKPFDLIIEKEKHSSVFSVSFPVSSESIVLNYLQRILLMLTEEVKFKTVLKKVLENQKRFKAEESLLMNELFNG
jgi:hypothetical protein